MMNHREIEFSEKMVKDFINVITRAEFIEGSFSRAKFVRRSFSGGLKPLTIFFEDDLI